MNPVLLKSLIGVGVAVSACAGTYGLYSYFSPKSIKEKLVKEGLIPLDLSKETTNGDSAEWNQKLTKYKGTGLESSRFDDLPASNSGSENVTLENLKDRCSKALNMSLSDAKASSTLDKAKTWCFKGTIEGQ